MKLSKTLLSDFVDRYIAVKGSNVEIDGGENRLPTVLVLETEDGLALMRGDWIRINASPDNRSERILDVYAEVILKQVQRERRAYH